MAVFPGPIIVTRPVAGSTLAVPRSSVPQTAPVAGWVVPLLKVTVAENCSLCPMRTISFGEVTVTELTVGEGAAPSPPPHAAIDTKHQMPTQTHRFILTLLRVDSEHP
jgi:hypothetical protein